MTTEKKKRNSSELSIGTAVTRILAIRSELSAAIAKAKQDVEDRFIGKEAAILERVPEEVRGLVRQKADAASGVAAPAVAVPDLEPPATTPPPGDVAMGDPEPPEEATNLRGTQPYTPSPVAQRARAGR